MTEGRFSASEEEEGKSLQLMLRNRPSRARRCNVSDGVIKFHGESVNSLDILSIQRVREFSILIPDCIDSKESELPFPRSIL